MKMGYFHRDMTVLGIETSCDDTAVAVITDGIVRSSVISSQLDHARFGGVVPELASRAHERVLVTVLRKALEEAGATLADVDGIAVTQGPGLVGSLLVGVSFAKTLAVGLGVPVEGVHHLDGHVHSLFLGDEAPSFPMLVLIVSGGHTQLMRLDAPGKRTLMGKTRDDAAGEAFDKVAKMLGLGYPGGPVIDRLAANGDPGHVAFPRTRLPGYDWSFSGIKTGVLYYLNAMPEKSRTEYLESNMAHVCASFQAAVVDMLVAPVERAMEATGIGTVGLVGGVSANSALRSRLSALTGSMGGQLHVPDLAHCMDNAAMIAMAGFSHLLTGHASPLTMTAHPSLPFGDLA